MMKYEEITLSFSKLTVASAVCVESKTPATTFRIRAFAVLAGKLATNPHHVPSQHLPKSFLLRLIWEEVVVNLPTSATRTVSQRLGVACLRGYKKDLFPTRPSRHSERPQRPGLRLLPLPLQSATEELARLSFPPTAMNALLPSLQIPSRLPTEPDAPFL